MFAVNQQPVKTRRGGNLGGLGLGKAHPNAVQNFAMFQALH
jgi:hypothetical protein